MLLLAHFVLGLVQSSFIPWNRRAIYLDGTRLDHGLLDVLVFWKLAICPL